MVDWEGQGDMAHVARTVAIVESAGPTQLLFAAWAQSRVIQSSNVGVEQAVKGIGVSDGFTANAPYLVASVHEKLDSGQADRGREARVQTPSVSHDKQATPSSSGCHVDFKFWPRPLGWNSK